MEKCPTVQVTGDDADVVKSHLLKFIHAVPQKPVGIFWAHGVSFKYHRGKDAIQIECLADVAMGANHPNIDAGLIYICVAVGRYRRDIEQRIDRYFKCVFNSTGYEGTISNEDNKKVVRWEHIVSTDGVSLDVIIFHCDYPTDNMPEFLTDPFDILSDDEIEERKKAAFNWRWK